MPTVFKAKTVIDTTIGLMEKRSDVFVSKSLNAIIYNPDSRYIAGLSFNSLNGLYTYALPVDIEAERYDAVEALCSMEQTFLENNMQISGIASDFAFHFAPDWEKCKKEDGENFVWFPSTACMNLAEAFDRGVWLGESFIMSTDALEEVQA